MNLKLNKADNVVEFYDDYGNFIESKTYEEVLIFINSIVNKIEEM